MYKIEL